MDFPHDVVEHNASVLLAVALFHYQVGQVELPYFRSVDDFVGRHRVAAVFSRGFVFLFLLFGGCAQFKNAVAEIVGRRNGQIVVDGNDFVNAFTVVLVLDS